MVSTFRCKTTWLLGLCLYAAALTVLTALQSSFPQNPTYHLFADQRVLFGVPHAGDVLSNLAFILTSLLGLGATRGKTQNRRAFADEAEHHPLQIFFIGLLLSGLGSAWYHLQPDNPRLLLDRLPMVLTTAGFASAVLGERLSPRIGNQALWPLLLLGLASVLWWGWSEHLGRGDLRFYALFQFGLIPPVIALLAMRPPRYSHGACYGIALLLYAAAKLAEHFDQALFDALGILSGHNLKHLLAAGVGLCLWWMLRWRRLL